MGNRDLVVIGGSAGAAAPLKTILALLPADIRTTVGRTSLAQMYANGRPNIAPMHEQCAQPCSVR